MSTKTEMLKWLVEAESATLVHMVRNDKGEFVESDRIVYNCADVPDSLINGDGFASMKSYGIRAFLSDRTSEFRQHGIAETKQAIEDVFRTTLMQGMFKAKRASKAGAVDRLLISAIAELKGIDLVQAEASLKALSKEQREQIAANAKIKDIMAKLASERSKAQAIDLDDLL